MKNYSSQITAAAVGITFGWLTHRLVSQIFDCRYAFPIALFNGTIAAGTQWYCSMSAAQRNPYLSNNLDTALQNMIQDQSITTIQRQTVQKLAKDSPTPMDFYKEIDQMFTGEKLSAAAAFYILQSYDAEKKRRNRVIKSIYELQQNKTISLETAYKAHQTYRIVRNDENEYGQTLENMALSSQTQRNLVLYQQTRWASNHEPSISIHSSTLRKNTRIFIPESIQSLRNPKHNTKIWVENTTTSSLAYQLAFQRFHPAMLDMANASRPGGGFDIGAETQEAFECRKSNLYEGLEAIKNKEEYPISELGVILAPDVLFFRDDQYKRTLPFPINVIASAAYDCNAQHTNGYNKPLDNELYERNTKEKMRAVMRAAVHNDNDSLVLSAFGCDTLKNDPQVIVRLYKEVFEEPEFKGRFKAIAFSVTDDPNGKIFQAFKDNFPGEPSSYTNVALNSQQSA